METYIIDQLGGIVKIPNVETLIGAAGCNVMTRLIRIKVLGMLDRALVKEMAHHWGVKVRWAKTAVFPLEVTPTITVPVACDATMERAAVFLHMYGPRDAVAEMAAQVAVLVELATTITTPQGRVTTVCALVVPAAASSEIATSSGARIHRIDPLAHGGSLNGAAPSLLIGTPIQLALARAAFSHVSTASHVQTVPVVTTKLAVMVTNHRAELGTIAQQHGVGMAISRAGHSPTGPGGEEDGVDRGATLTGRETGISHVGITGAESAVADAVAALLALVLRIHQYTVFGADPIGNTTSPTSLLGLATTACTKASAASNAKAEDSSDSGDAILLEVCKGAVRLTGEDWRVRLAVALLCALPRFDYSAHCAAPPFVPSGGGVHEGRGGVGEPANRVAVTFPEAGLLDARAGLLPLAIRASIELPLAAHGGVAGAKDGKLLRVARGGVTLALRAETPLTFTLDIVSRDVVLLARAVDSVMAEVPLEHRLYIPAVFHARCIGAGGCTVQRVMRRWGVYIEFYGATSGRGGVGELHPGAFRDAGDLTTSAGRRTPNTLIKGPQRNAAAFPTVAAELRALASLGNDSVAPPVVVTRNQYRLYPAALRRIEEIERSRAVSIEWPTVEPEDTVEVRISAPVESMGSTRTAASAAVDSGNGLGVREPRSARTRAQGVHQTDSHGLEGEDSRTSRTLAFLSTPRGEIREGEDGDVARATSACKEAAADLMEYLATQDHLIRVTRPELLERFFEAREDEPLLQGAELIRTVRFLFGVELQVSRGCIWLSCCRSCGQGMDAALEVVGAWLRARDMVVPSRSQEAPLSGTTSGARALIW